MKSEIAGELEKLAAPIIAELRSCWAAGVPVTLSPKRAGQYAKVIELLTQCIDAQEAVSYADRHFVRTIGLTLLLIALFVFMATR